MSQSRLAVIAVVLVALVVLFHQLKSETVVATPPCVDHSAQETAAAAANAAAANAAAANAAAANAAAAAERATMRSALDKALEQIAGLKPLSHDAQQQMLFIDSFAEQQEAFCRQSAFLGPHPNITLKDRIKPHKGIEPFPMYVYGNTRNDIVSYHIYYEGSWENQKWEEIYDKLTEVSQTWKVPRDEVAFMDVGGNVGWFTNLAAAAGHPTLTFEAYPLNEIILRSTLCQNPSHMRRVHLFATALGDKQGNCVIVSFDGNLGNGVLDCSQAQGTVFEGARVRARVPMTSLDHLFFEEKRGDITRFFPRIGVLKIDIEGFEPYLVKGAMRFFRTMRIPYITSELNVETMKLRNETTKPLLDMWDSLGYDVRRSNWSSPVIPPSQFGDPNAFRHDLDELYLTLRT